MDIVSCEGTEGFAKGASDWCARRVAEFDAKSLFVPAGETPLPLYELWEREKPAYLEGLRLVQVDDVLTGAKKGLFRAFLEAKLPSFRAQVDFISEAAAGARAARARAQRPRGFP
jgi:6-phosphogluconolactonase/glucosamine-6-phosphate isomerase/deaminase